MLLLVIELPSAEMMIDDREIGQGPTYVYAMLPTPWFTRSIGLL